MNFQTRLYVTRVYITTLIKWLIVSIVVGILCGAVGVMFHYAIDFVTEYRQEYKWVVFLAPIAGVLIAILYNKTSMKQDRGTNGIFEAARYGEKVKARLAPLIFVTTVLTHLVGGSSGREGAALQMGGSIGASIARIFNMKKKDYKTIIICGMSAAFSALFGTPLTATIFCLEVINVGVFHYSLLMPALSSALVSYQFAIFLGVTPSFFKLPGAPQEFNVISGFTILILSLLCGLVSILLCKTMNISSKLYKKYLPNPYIRGIVGGGLLIIITLVEGSGDYNGAGMDLVTKAISGAEIVPWAFLLKLAFTAITLGAGFKGGEIVPTLCIGATFGSVAGVFLGLDPGFAAAIGLVSVFCGALNGPIASLVLSIEFFGSGSLLYFAIACAISFMLSGRYSLYAAQRIMYSKLEPSTMENADT